MRNEWVGLSNLRIRKLVHRTMKLMGFEKKDHDSMRG